MFKSHNKCENGQYSKEVMLNDKNTDQKVYWTVLDNILHDIKIPSIPPILASGETITNSVEKAN